MALSRADKEQLVDRYESGMADAAHAFLLGFSGITVPQDTELRTKIREVGASYMVVKNRLVLRAVEGKPLGELKEQFSGPTAVAFSDDDAVVLAKTLTEFAKQVPALEFKGALVNSQVVPAEQVKEISELPSREALIAKLLYLMQSPVTGLARTLAAVPRDFVVVLDQIRQSKEAQG